MTAPAISIQWVVSSQARFFFQGRPMRLRLSFGLSIASLYLVSTYLIHGRCSDLRSFLNGTEFDAANPFLFWLDYPGSPEYEKNKPVW